MLGARVCYRNALHLYKAGADLVPRGEVGAGRSLTILALEEVGKALIYSMLEVGVFTTDTAQSGARPFIDPRVFRCHRCKQGLVYAMEIGWSAMGLLGTFPTEADLGGDKATTEVASTLLAQFIETTAANPPAREVIEGKLRAAPVEVASLTQLFADRKATEDTKWEGFYVDYEAAPPTSPQKVKIESYERVRGFVAKRLIDFSGYFLTEFPEDEWTKIKAAFAGMRLPVMVLVCPRNRPLDHPTTSRQLTEATLAAKGIPTSPLPPPARRFRDGEVG